MLRTTIRHEHHPLHFTITAACRRCSATHRRSSTCLRGHSRPQQATARTCPQQAQSSSSSAFRCPQRGAASTTSGRCCAPAAAGAAATAERTARRQVQKCRQGRCAGRGPRSVGGLRAPAAGKEKSTEQSSVRGSWQRIHTQFCGRATGARSLGRGEKAAQGRALQPPHSSGARDCPGLHRLTTPQLNVPAGRYWQKTVISWNPDAKTLRCGSL